jgi:7-cyano-7-deazaguanine synthase in queuosine biosynthesis
MDKVISLVSGGLDSILATEILLSQGNEVLMLFIACNQNPEPFERIAVEYFRDLFTCRYPHKIDYLEQTLDLKGPKKVESTWGRTLLFLGCALTYDYSQRDMYYNAIALGGHKGDIGLDVNPDNQEAFEKAVSVSSKGTVKFLLPIKDMNQEAIGKEYKTRDLPIEKTYNCYWSVTCGYKSTMDTYRCQGCRRKTIAMKAAGITDSGLLDLPNTKFRVFQSPYSEKARY